MNRRVFSIVFVVLAGEAVFMLPFMIPRLYRPLMLEAWGLTNTSFGTAFSAYGILAMLSYAIGGPFADRYHPRVLRTASLALTAMGSFYLAQFPSAVSLVVTYGFFGVSTILLMWSALIKATHLAGGEDQRSLAMGALDGGRGLAAAAFGSILILIVSMAAPHLSAPLDQLKALKIIYFSTAAFTLFIAAGVWISLKDFQSTKARESRWEFGKAVASLKNAQIWLLSVVVLGSYCGYKGIDNYSTYLVSVYKIDLSSASKLTSVVFWLRPIAALVAGGCADRAHEKIGNGRFLVLLILLSLGAASQILLAFAGAASFGCGFAVILFSAVFAYSLRAVYFSVFGDLKIPNYLVGTSAGVVSFVGFLPDIFFGLVTGRLIDSFPGELGFQCAFLFTAACLIMGAAASFLLYRSTFPEKRQTFVLEPMKSNFESLDD